MSVFNKPMMGVLAVVLALGVFSAVSSFADDKAESKINWKEEMPEEADKPVLLYFTADWCGPCQHMKRTTWADDAVAEMMNDKVIPVMVDIDNNREVAQQYEIRGVPTVVLLDKDMNEKSRFVGARSADDVKKFLEEHAAEA